MARNSLAKRALASALCGMLSVSLLEGCADKKTNSTAKYKPISDSDDTNYSIALLATESNDRTSSIQAGFRDALTDTLGEKHYTLTIQTADDQHSVSSLASQIVNAGSSSKENKTYALLAAEGTSALTAASESTSSLPIVAMDVLNIRNTLHLQGDSWSDPTSMNITGISSKIPLADYISMMIEATKNVTSVGLLYSPDDSDAIAQNETMETYLTEAGIPWKEYELQSTIVAKSALKNATQSGTSNEIILPNKIVAPNSVAGTYSSPEDLVGADLQGLNDTSSARTPKQSDNWYKSPAQGSTDPNATGGTTGLPSPAPAPVTEESITAANTVILQTAASECSALILPPNSYLRDQSKLISDIGTSAGVTTLAGDLDAGSNMAVTMYLDPYAIGYAAGQQVYRILVGNETPGNMEIESVPGSTLAKLYNPDVCQRLHLTLGKSFHSISDYLAEHPSGSTTERITNEDNAKSK